MPSGPREAWVEDYLGSVSSGGGALEAGGALGAGVAVGAAVDELPVVDEPGVAEALLKFGRAGFSTWYSCHEPHAISSAPTT